MKNKGLTLLEYLLIIKWSVFYILAWVKMWNILPARDTKAGYEVESRWYLKKQIHKERVENNLYCLHTVVCKVSKPSDIDILSF